MQPKVLYTYEVEIECCLKRLPVIHTALEYENRTIQATCEICGNNKLFKKGEDFQSLYSNTNKDYKEDEGVLFIWLEKENSLSEPIILQCKENDVHILAENYSNVVVTKYFDV